MDIHISETNPKRALETLEIGARTASRHVIWSVPDRFDGVVVALIRGNCHFRAEAHVVPSGVWIVDLEPGHVPEAIESEYEVFGIEGERKQYLGRGKLSVVETSEVGEELEPIEGATVLPLYDADGALHTVKVVRLDNGDYTLQVD